MIFISIKGNSFVVFFADVKCFCEVLVICYAVPRLNIADIWHARLTVNCDVGEWKAGYFERMSQSDENK